MQKVWSVIMAVSISAASMAVADGVTTSATPSTNALAAYTPHAANPILPGYYADPSIVQHDGRVYIYATLDPWGGDTLGCWESTDWKNWTYRTLNWPTKAACTSPTSRSAKVWAPSVLRGADGKFHMVVSVGSEVWAGVADSPLGPWKDACGGKPLIAYDFKPGFHMIDAELFLDTNGQAYLYWGSGFEWINGKCWAVKLKPDMATFDGDVKDVTPANYFEAPFMIKRGGRYNLMYSAGKTTEDTYQVHVATADSPFGPFKESSRSPVLVTDKANDVISPGHHAVFEKDGKSYILYHRHSVPFDPKFVGRQTCVDELTFSPEGVMNKVVPTHSGPAWASRVDAARPLLSATATFTASSQSGPLTGPERVGDDNYATRWTAAADTKGAWLQLDFGSIKNVTSQRIRPEYAWKAHRFLAMASADGTRWETIADHTKVSATGSPIVIDTPVAARYLKLQFSDDVKGSDASIWEWSAD